MIFNVRIVASGKIGNPDEKAPVQYWARIEASKGVGGGKQQLRVGTGGALLAVGMKLKLHADKKGMRLLPR